MNHSLSSRESVKLGECLAAQGILAEDAIAGILEQQARYRADGDYRLFGQICVEQGLISRQALQTLLKKQGLSIRLGELLVARGALAPTELETALAAQKQQPDQRLGEILLARQAISEQALVEALSQQLDLPLLQPSVDQLDFALLEGLDLKFMHENGCLPLNQSEGEITVAMFQPNDMNAVNFLELHYGKKLRRALATLSQVRQTLKDYYHQRKAELEQQRKAARLQAQAQKSEASKADPAPPPAAVGGDGEMPFNFLIFEENLKKQQAKAKPRGGGFHGGLGDEAEDLSLVGLSLGGGSEDAVSEGGESPGLRSGSLYDEPAPRRGKKPEPAAPAAVQEPPVELPPAPIVVEDNLIVGGISLSSGQSEHKQQESMLNYLIKNALIDQAAAVHLEPQGMFIRIRYRIDGVLHQKTALPANLAVPMVARLKQICGLDAANTGLPQRARVQASFNDSELELSLATYPDAHGETMVLNLRQKQMARNSPFLKLDQAGFAPLNLHRFKKLIGQAGGLIVVTGPGRAGKTSTVYAALNELNLLTRSIRTAECPIEVSIPGLSQGSWSPGRGLSFPEMVRSMAYLDADVLMIGELDAAETVEAAVELALGGAKVISTFPSFDSLGALMRLKSQGLEPFLIASSNLALVSQRLVRKLCQACRAQEAPHRELLNLLGLVGVDPSDHPVWVPRGCDECQQLGYKGQTVLHELLIINETLREALLDQQPAARIRALARNEGKLVSMAEDGYYKAVEGITSLSEVQRAATITEYDSHSPRSGQALIPILRGEQRDWL